MTGKINSELDEQYFKRNRYIKDEILTAFEKLEAIDKIFYLDISKDDIVEIHLDEEVTRDLLVEIISKIQEFDNYVQDFCELNSVRGSFSYANYMVLLSWMKIEQNKVIMGYWGERVNIELRTIFVKNELVWENKEIYYQ